MFTVSEGVPQVPPAGGSHEALSRTRYSGRGAGEEEEEDAEHL